MSAMLNEYSGYHPKSRDEILDVIDATRLSASEFHYRYIQQRRPCIIKNFTPLHSGHEWTNDYLRQHAGDVSVRAERRLADGMFGLSKRDVMKFADVISAVEAHDDSLYMTTQYGDDDEDANEHEDDDGDDDESANNDDVDDIRYLIAPPLTALLPSFTLTPPLLSSLCLHQVNMWFGHARNKSSSSLHHDYHDNLYCLLRGTKHLILFSPGDMPTLQAHSSHPLRGIHTNGLAYYDEGRYADGSTDHERFVEKRLMLEERLQRAAATLKSARAKSAKQSAERELEEAKDAMEELLMDMAMKRASQRGSKHDDSDGDDDDDDDDDEEAADGFDEDLHDDFDDYNDDNDDKLIGDQDDLHKNNQTAQKRSRESALNDSSAPHKQPRTSDAEQTPPNFSSFSSLSPPESTTPDTRDTNSIR